MGFCGKDVLKLMGRFCGMRRQQMASYQYLNIEEKIRTLWWRKWRSGQRRKKEKKSGWYVPREGKFYWRVMTNTEMSIKTSSIGQTHISSPIISDKWPDFQPPVPVTFSCFQSLLWPWIWQAAISFPEVTSQINCLYSNSCLRFSF